MPQLGHFTKTCLDSSGNAQLGASVTLYREGATANGSASGTSPLTVTVHSPGKLAAGDSVFIGTTTTTTYNVSSKTATTVVLSGFSGTLSVLDGDRLVPSNAQPTLYSDDQGTNSTTNPLSSSSRGFAHCFMEAGGYDVLTAKGTDKVLEYYLVTPTQAPAQVRWADEFAWSGSTSGGIQEALNDLPTAGGKVLLSNKTYSVSAKITVPSKATLQGCGMGSTVVQLTADAILLENSDTTNGNTYITLRDITFDGNNTVTTSNTNVLVHMKRVSQLRVEGCEFRQCRADGLYIQAATAAKHVWVNGCYFHNTQTNVTSTGHAALYVFTGGGGAVTQVQITNNIFESIGTDNASTGVGLDAIITGGGTGNDQLLVSGNTLTSIQATGIKITNSGNILCNGNTIKSVGLQNVTDGGNGIFVDSTGTGKVSITNNVIDTIPANSDNGIEVSGPITDFECVCSGNRIRNVLNANKYGIGTGGFGKISVTGNVIASCAGVGVQNSTDGPTAGTSIVLTGNVCDTCGLGGINIRGKARVVISGNDCSASTSGFGIQVGESTTTSGAEASEVAISGNTCSGNATQGINIDGELVGAAGQLARRLSVTGNVVKGNTGDGINLESVSNVTLTGNVISSNTGDGIQFTTSVADLVVDGNIISDNGGLGINLNSITPTRFLLGGGNLIYNNTGGNASAAVGTPTLSGATPAVPGVNRAIVTNGGATTVTNLTGGVDGQVLQLQHTDANTTYTDGTNIFLSGSANYNPTATSCLTLMSVAGKWYELGRSAN